MGRRARALAAARETLHASLPNAGPVPKHIVARLTSEGVAHLESVIRAQPLLSAQPKVREALLQTVFEALNLLDSQPEGASGASKTSNDRQSPEASSERANSSARAAVCRSLGCTTCYWQSDRASCTVCGAIFSGTRSIYPAFIPIADGPKLHIELAMCCSHACIQTLSSEEWLESTTSAQRREPHRTPTINLWAFLWHVFQLFVTAATIFLFSQAVSTSNRESEKEDIVIPRLALAPCFMLDLGMWGLLTRVVYQTLVVFYELMCIVAASRATLVRLEWLTMLAFIVIYPFQWVSTLPGLAQCLLQSDLSVSSVVNTLTTSELDSVESLRYQIFIIPSVITLLDLLLKVIAGGAGFAATFSRFFRGTEATTCLAVSFYSIAIPLAYLILSVVGLIVSPDYVVQNNAWLSLFGQGPDFNTGLYIRLSLLIIVGASIIALFIYSGFRSTIRTGSDELEQQSAQSDTTFQNQLKKK